MTVTYSLEVSNTRLGGFAKLLLRWRGSIYRLMYREMIIFTVMYYSVAVVYRYVLPENEKRAFEEIARYCREFTDLIPITFVMGFYVAVVVGRWWQQYLAIPWPDRCCHQIAAYVQGGDERGRLIRRGLARYLNLLSVLTMQATSTVVRKRFPTVEHLVQSGLMTEEERLALETTVAPHGNWWIPASWFCQLAMQARKEGRIHDDLHLKSLIDDALTFRGNCGLMWSFDWISVPLVYTQVVTIAVYSFFGACLFGRQYLERSTLDGQSSYAIDFYVPIFTFFQFFFYMGWLKVAEQLINPYGEDDDDFELSWIIDRNLQVSYTAVDGLYQRYPKLVRDAFWDETDPELPYTEAAVNFNRHPFLGSTMTMNFNPREKGWRINTIPEEDRKIPVKINRLDSTNLENGTIPCRHSSTPRSINRFLNSLMKGELWRFNSRCDSKSSLSSSSPLRRKSPTPVPIAEHKSSIIDTIAENDDHEPWAYAKGMDVQRQWSSVDSEHGSPHHVYQLTETPHLLTLATDRSIDDPQSIRHVTFDESIDEQDESIPTSSNDLTPLEVKIDNARSDESDVPIGNDSEQMTVNSRTLLLQKNLHDDVN